MGYSDLEVNMKERNYWKNKRRWVKNVKMALTCPMTVPGLKDDLERDILHLNICFKINN